MKVAIILGNKMKDDGNFSETMKKRLSLTLKLYGELKPDKIILSGGIANKKANVAESHKMYDYLMGVGIPADILIKEDKSRTTKENAKYSVPMAKLLKADTVILCSTKEHIERKWLNPIKLFKKQIGNDSGIRLEIYTNN